MFQVTISKLVVPTPYVQMYWNKTTSKSTPSTIIPILTTEGQQIENNFISQHEIMRKKTENVTEKAINTEHRGKQNTKTKKMVNRINIINNTKEITQDVTTSLPRDESIDILSSPPPPTNLYKSTRNSINQVSDGMLAGIPTSLKQTKTVPNEIKGEATSQNANETKSEDKKLDNNFIAQISRNLFVERKFKMADNDEVPIDSLGEVSTGEMSMFTKNKQIDDASFLLHPGMLILAFGIMGAAAALAMLAAKFTRKRRNSSISREEDIEVNSLPSVTELW